MTTQEYTDEMNHRTAVAEATRDSNLLYSIRSFIQGINMVHSNTDDPTGTLSNATTQTVMGSDTEFEFDPPAYESLISPGENRTNSNNCNGVTNNNNNNDRDKYVTVTPSIRFDHVTEGHGITAVTPPCDNNNSTYTGSAPQRRENTPPPTYEDVTCYLPTPQSRV